MEVAGLQSLVVAVVYQRIVDHLLIRLLDNDFLLSIVDDHFVQMSHVDVLSDLLYHRVVRVLSVGVAVVVDAVDYLVPRQQIGLI